MINANKPVSPCSVMTPDDVYSQAKCAGIDISPMIEFTGLTKREHFSALAMQGMLCDPKIKATPDEFASYAVQMADALLKRLDK